jgi:signal transduction histidine kinase/Flp pilus assembly protein TadD
VFASEKMISRDISSCSVKKKNMKSPSLMLFVALYFLCLRIQAQTPEIETLVKTISETTGKERMEACTDLSFRYYSIDPAKGIHYGELALRLADSLKLPGAKGKIFNNLGANHLALSNHSAARSSFHQALQYAREAGDSLEMASACNRLGLVYEKTGVFDSALQVFQTALAYYKRNKNLERTGVLNENIGMIHLHRGELKTALSFFLEAKTSFESAGIRNKLASVYLKIGRVYSETGDFVEAEKWYQKGKLLSLEAGDFQTAAIAINAMGIMFKNQQKYEEALQHYLEVINIADRIKNKNLLLAVYGNIGNVYQQLGNYRKALEFHQQALPLAIQLNNPLQIAHEEFGLGDACKGLSDYTGAVKHFEKALPVFQASQAWSDLLVTYQGLIEANNGLKKYDRSVIFYEKYIAIRDSLNKNELNSALDSLKVKFKTEQTMQENTLLSQTNEIHIKTIALQRTIMVSAILFAFILLVFIFVVVRNRKKLKKAHELLALKNAEISMKAEELALKNSQLMAYSQYKDSMNSFLVHDLKNPLNTIINLDAGHITPQQAEGARQSGWQMLQIVSNLLDLGKYEHTSMTLTTGDAWLAKVIHQAFSDTTYLAEQKSIRLILHFKTDYLIVADQEIIKRVFVNLFTNAIKFSPAGGHIRIFTELTTTSMVKIVVQDEGEGISPDYLPFVFEKFTQGIPRSSGFSVSTGIGLAFCKMAVEAHGGTIGVVSDQGHGSSFWLTLPLSESKALMPDIPFDTDGMPEAIPALQLTAEEKKYLAPFCKALQHTSIHQLTEVKDIVKTIEDRSAHLSTWKQLILQALSVCNEPKYHELIRLCHDEPV